MRFLVIDDNHDIADSMRILLALLGHEVQVAYCGEDGVAMADKWSPAVVLSDIGLPDMNGFAVARELRENKSLRDATLVAITAYDTDAMQEHAYKSGFDLFMTKPTDLTALLDTLQARNRARVAASPEIDPSQTSVS